MLIKKVFKILGILILAVIVFFIAAEVGFQAKYRLEQWKTARKMEQFNKIVEELFKNDIYGGKTPEETYNLFVTSLKNEDVDLAVKYIILDAERQRKYYDKFSDKKQKGTLKKYVESLPKWEEFKQVKDEYNDWVSEAMIEHKSYYPESEIVELPDGAGGYIKTELPPGNYVDYSITFVKNINNIWKISSF